MKPLLPTLVLLAALAPAAGLAHPNDRDCGTLSMQGCRAPAHWADRHETRGARVAITTRSGKVAMLLTEDCVALQLSDRTYGELRRKLRDEQREHEDNELATAIRAVVFSTVRIVLGHSAECDVDDLRDILWKDGRLVLIANNGRHVFRRLEVDDESVLASFSESDALALIREFHKIQGRSN